MAAEAGEEVLSPGEIVLIAGAALIGLVSVAFCVACSGACGRKEKRNAQTEEVKDRRSLNRLSAKNEWLEEAVRSAALGQEPELPVFGRRNSNDSVSSSKGSQRPVLPRRNSNESVSSSKGSQRPVLPRRNSNESLASSAAASTISSSRRVTFELDRRPPPEARSLTKASAASLSSEKSVHYSSERSSDSGAGHKAGGLKKGRGRSGSPRIASPQQQLRAAARGDLEEGEATPSTVCGSPPAFAVQPPGFLMDSPDLEEGSQQVLEQELRAMAQQARMGCVPKARFELAPDQDATPPKPGRRQTKAAQAHTEVAGEEARRGPKVDHTRSLPLSRGPPSQGEHPWPKHVVVYRSEGGRQDGEGKTRAYISEGSEHDGERWAQAARDRRPSAVLKSAPHVRPHSTESRTSATLLLDVEGLPPREPPTSRSTTANSGVSVV